MVMVRIKNCRRRLPTWLLASHVRCAVNVVAGLGADGRSAAARGAAALLWHLQTHPLDGGSSWRFANDCAGEVWRDRRALRLGRCRLENETAVLYFARPNGGVAGALYLATRWIEKDAQSADGWFTPENCSASRERGPEDWLARTDVLVFALNANTLYKREDREKARRHARILARAVSASAPGVRARRHFILLVDHERQFLASLGDHSATAQDFGRDIIAWQDVAHGYVYENLRLGELLEPLIEATGGGRPLPLFVAAPLNEAGHNGTQLWADANMDFLIDT